MNKESQKLNLDTCTELKVNLNLGLFLQYVFSR